MGRMIFDLTDEDREALERIRKFRGDRSQAETLRQLIRVAAHRNGDIVEMAVMRMGPPRPPSEPVNRTPLPGGPVRPKPGSLLKKR